MNDTVIIHYVLFLLCTGLSCGQTVLVCRTVDRL